LFYSRGIVGPNWSRNYQDFDEIAGTALVEETAILIMKRQVPFGRKFHTEKQLLWQAGSPQ
jgi:hypothetical protein